MPRYYDELAQYERDGFTIIVDKSYEDMHPSESFDNECYDIKELCNDIDSGRLDWFMLRVRVLVEGLELASEYLGGCLYKDAREVLTDGTAEDLIDSAMVEAKSKVYGMYKKFQELSFNIDSEGINAQY